MKSGLIAGGLLAYGFLTILPEAALARPHHVRHVRHYSGCESQRRSHANTGTALGAIGGGLLGNQVAGRGSRTTGTLVGAGVGAVVGHQVAKGQYHCR